MIFNNRGSTTSLLFGRSRRRKQARRDAAFAKFRSQLAQKTNDEFMRRIEARRMALMPANFRYREDTKQVESKDFDIKKTQLAADRLAEKMLTESRGTKRSLGMVRIGRRKM